MQHVEKYVLFVEPRVLIPIFLVWFGLVYVC